MEKLKRLVSKDMLQLHYLQHVFSYLFIYQKKLRWGNAPVKYMLIASDNVRLDHW